MINNIQKTLANLRTKKPLILCLTNLVTMEFVANTLLAVGAAPIMTTSENEINELVNIASALYINIGTLNDPFIKLSAKAIEIAQKHNVPIVFDPVGAGATTIRTNTSKSILPFAKFVRGNSSEIIALADHHHQTYGVEATHTTDEAASIATSISKKNNLVVMVSGPVDLITNGDQSIKVPFGSKLMQTVTGMGCTLTAVIAAFQSIEQDPFQAVIIAAHYFALCGEVVSKKYQTPGAFKVAFLDQLHTPDIPSMRALYDQRR
ncbi:hydroxyethylthiazole kinase [Rickettsiales endosymbiont of Peranema trichophorum]|uniref:hydroxyethylthiazole kinase n=1 Tax=Rickettsiales endosymbiont of Peranema trichophorum TaxID=2486577 RepID=UPI0010233AA0|nr:hydroxyethylthiazole kinase [Rickettsiales endosymbiont of Peranema trichophorum]RZI45539.1 hydroxyethylthiazole kinase [Rickettsiales endosymbiont of Peranema trichophorum]